MEAVVYGKTTKFHSLNFLVSRLKIISNTIPGKLSFLWARHFCWWLPRLGISLTFLIFFMNAKLMLSSLFCTFWNNLMKTSKLHSWWYLPWCF